MCRRAKRCHLPPVSFAIRNLFHLPFQVGGCAIDKQAEVLLSRRARTLDRYRIATTTVATLRSMYRLAGF